MQERLFYQIALTQYQHIGLRTAHLLIENFGDAQTLFGADNATLKSLGKVGDYLSDKTLRDNAFRRAEKELKFIEEQHIRTLLMGDEAIHIG